MSDGMRGYRTWVRYGEDPLDVRARSLDEALAAARALRPGTDAARPLADGELGAFAVPTVTWQVWVTRGGEPWRGRSCRDRAEAERFMDVAGVPEAARRWEADGGAEGRER